MKGFADAVVPAAVHLKKKKKVWEMGRGGACRQQHMQEQGQLQEEFPPCVYVCVCGCTRRWQYVRVHHNVTSRSHSGHRLGGRPDSLLAFTLVLEIQTRFLMPEQQTVNPLNCLPSQAHLCPTGSVHLESSADPVSLSTEERQVSYCHWQQLP